MVVFFGIFADLSIDRVVRKQLEVARTYNSMLHTSQHILANLLNQMQLFRYEALKSKDFDREIIEFYDNAIEETSDLIDTLSKVGDVTREYKT